MEQQETLGILWDKGNEEEGEKVCPNCGMPLYGKDAYCMGCGMTVAPMDKKEYENRKAGEAAGGAAGTVGGTGSYGGAGTVGGASGTYGSTGTVGGASGTYGSTGTYGGGTGSYGNTGTYGSGLGSYGSSGRSTVRYGNQTANSGYLIFVGIIGIAALICAIFFVIKGITATEEETQTVYTRQVVTKLPAGSLHRDETVKIYAKGDKIQRVITEVIWDMDEIQRSRYNLEIFKNTSNSELTEKYSKYSFITYDCREEGNKLIFSLDYNYLNVMENMKTLLDEKLMEFNNGKRDVGYKDYISLKETVKNLKEAQYRKVGD